MDTFYFIVISVALILLIILLTFIGIRMKNNMSGDDKAIYPPKENSCPELWLADTNVNNDGEDEVVCIIPYDQENTQYKQNHNADGLLETNNSGKNILKSEVLNNTPGLSSGADPKSINFNVKGWGSGGEKPICAKKNWANSNNIAWDGVSNYNQC